MRVRLKIFTKSVTSINELFKNKIKREQMAKMYTL